MKISFKISREEFFAAQKLHAKRLRIYLWPMLGVIPIFMFWTSGYNVLDLIFGFVLIAVITPLCSILPKIMARRAFETNKVFSQERDVSWSDHGIEVSGSWGHIQHGWSDLHRWAEDNRLLVIYPSSNTFLVLPKRAFTDEAELADLKHRLTENKVQRR